MSQVGPSRRDIMPVVNALKLNGDQINMVKSRPKALIRWLYSISYFIFLGIWLTLSAAVPIDIIIQSTQSDSRLAASTIIVIGACAVFLASSVVMYLVRVLIVRTHLQDIPNAYIPVTPGDIPRSVSKYIHNKFVECQKIKKKAEPRGRVMHSELYHQYPSDKSSLSLPNNLVYANVIHSIGEDIKYRGQLVISRSLHIKVDRRTATLREVLLSKYKQGSQDLSKDEVFTLYQFLSLYEALRYSGRPIEHSEFVRFLSLWNHVKQDITKHW